MSYIVWRDLLDMEEDDPIFERVNGLDDIIIQKYQQGWVEDEFGYGWTIGQAEEYMEEKGYPVSFPEPSSYDTLLILIYMIKNGEIDLNGNL
jgi:predicted 3-demethylubiquinone-9 3-methyltransferase (glyoxalase superfamily)